MQFLSDENIEQIFEKLRSAEENLPSIPSPYSPQLVSAPDEVPSEMLITRLTNSIPQTEAS